MRPLLIVFAMLFWLQPAAADELGRGLSAFRHGDYELAVAIVKPLARDGDPYAQYSLAVMYDDGLGVPRNYQLALMWYEKAGAQGLADAQYMAGRHYGSGRGAKQNPGAALFWLELAAAAGHPLAPLLRDQHWNQLRSPKRDEIAAKAVAWQAEHPRQLTCRFKSCIYPRSTKRPPWTLFDAAVAPF